MVSKRKGVENNNNAETSSKRSRRKRDEEEDEAADYKYQQDDNAGFAVPETQPSQIPTEDQIEAGIIEYIKLENFMCHRALEFHFNPCINVINGANGSGKSAFLTGLQICLGAKAGSTNRGSSLKHLIMTGKDVALITVHLRNLGPDAYKPEVYGRKIIIERRIDKTSAGYKIKNHEGKTISTKYKDLVAILEQFNIQIDNPCTVMSQDTSRSFITSPATDKYKFFLKATQLQKMQEDLEATQIYKNQLETHLNQQKEALDVHLKDVNALRHELDALNKLEKRREEVGKLSHRLAWAMVQEAEQKQQRAKERVEFEMNKYNKELQKLKEITDLIDQANKQNQTSNEEVERFTAKINEVTNEITQIDESLKTFVKDRKSREIEIQGAHRRIAAWNKEIKENRDKIEATKKKAAKDKSAELDKRNKELSHCQSEKSRLEAELQQANNQMANAAKRSKELDAEAKAIESRRAEIQNNLHDKNQILQQLKSQKDDRIKFFGEEMPRLLAEIEKNKSQFERPPIGPIGLLISLKDNRWALAAERALKYSRMWFIVHSKKDEETLKQIAKRIRMRGIPDMVVQRFTDRGYDTSGSKPVDHNGNPFLTLEDMLKLDEQSISSYPIKYDPSILGPTIFNVLRDQNQIENIILLDNIDAAREVMHKNQPPRHAKSCYIPDGTQLFKKKNSNVTLGNPDQRARLWGANVEQQIREIQQQVDQYNHELEQITPQLKALHAEKQKCHQENAQAASKKRSITSSLTKLQSKIDDLERPLEEEAQEDLSALESEIEKLKTEIAMAQQQISELEKEIAEIDEKMRPGQEKKNEKQAEKAKLVHESSVVSKRAVIALEESAKLENKRKQLEKKVTEHYERIKSLQDDYRRLEDETAELTNQATEMNKITGAERIYNITESSDKLQQQIINLNNRLEAEQRNRKSYDEVKREYEDKNQNYQTLKAQLQQSQENLMTIKRGASARNRKWTLIRDTFASYVSHQFNNYLLNKGHTGTLKFDHQAGTLAMMVQMHKHDQNRMTTDVKELSGGERSFSTVAFLLSLWDVVECPFRAMDEFDIFMDAVYRKKSMNLLIDNAQGRHSRRQLFIITPHDVSMLKPGPKLKIHRLREPVRGGQTTLDQYVQQQQQQQQQ